MKKRTPKKIGRKEGPTEPDHSPKRREHPKGERRREQKSKLGPEVTAPDPQRGRGHDAERGQRRGH